MKRHALRKIADKLFKTKEGKYVIGQRPNWPIILWGFATLAGYVVKSPDQKFGLSISAHVALLIWAGMEIFSGVNVFRRLLGGIVAAFTLASTYMLLR